MSNWNVMEFVRVCACVSVSVCVCIAWLFVLVDEAVSNCISINPVEV